MSKQNSNRGFTLQELMIVMAIVTIMSASLLPNINTAMQNYRLKASAEEIASQIQSARYRARRSNTVCAFLVLPSSRQFGVDVNGDGNLTVGTDIVLNLNTNVSFSDLSASPPTGSSGSDLLSSGSKTGLGFTPRATLSKIGTDGLPTYGTAVGANGFAIYLSNTTNRFSAVTISFTGRVRIWSSGNGSTWI